ncbi:hypothetical protein EDB83DRAFT_2682289 [Lactarius deliciosus]|nr:hypothetical protein EDB83DRAFT_2682289 [Lactarius deliciosus]
MLQSMRRLVLGLYSTYEPPRKCGTLAVWSALEAICWTLLLLCLRCSCAAAAAHVSAELVNAVNNSGRSREGGCLYNRMVIAIDLRYLCTSLRELWMLEAP